MVLLAGLAVEAVAVTSDEMEPVLDGVLVGGATLGGEVAGLYVGFVGGAVGSIGVCGMDGSDPCFSNVAVSGTVVGSFGGGIGTGALVALAADVSPGRVAKWAALPGAAGAGLVLAGLFVEPSSQSSLVPLGAAVGLIGMPLAAGFAAASDPVHDEGASWGVAPDVRQDGAGFVVAGRF